MLGRINQTKGQEILIEAVGRLPQHLKSKVLVRIVGDAFEDQSREVIIRSLVDQLELAGIVRIEPFTADPAALYSWSDIVVVPSRKPESLGRVAIEAMAFGRPTLVSAIGGLVEIVDDGKTGWLVPPGRADLLSGVLQTVIENPAAWAEFGSAARRRYEMLFSEQSVSQAFAALLETKLAGRYQKSSLPGESPTVPDPR
jgi:glycosyltransferase involved in cell wall biosynthesis